MKHFPFCKLKDWLTKNAEGFGFYEVYTDDGISGAAMDRPEFKRFKLYLK